MCARSFSTARHRPEHVQGELLLQHSGHTLFGSPFDLQWHRFAGSPIRLPPLVCIGPSAPPSRPGSQASDGVSTSGPLLARLSSAWMKAQAQEVLTLAMVY